MSERLLSRIFSQNLPLNSEPLHPCFFLSLFSSLVVLTSLDKYGWMQLYSTVVHGSAIKKDGGKSEQFLEYESCTIRTCNAIYPLNSHHALF